MPQNQQVLEKYLSDHAKETDKFPKLGRRNYYSIYEDFADTLAAEVHPYIAIVAAKKDGSFLTDHGPDHVATVMRRAYELLGPEGLEYISPYQVFVLLSAIQIHDAGHIIGGRKQHEQTSRNIIKSLNVSMLEQRLIWFVAKVHGGLTEDSDKDTISRVSERDYFDVFEIKLQFLAALLRFSDELADDQSRAALYLLSKSDILGSSTIYHAYARALNSVTVDRAAREVKLKFDLNLKDVTESFIKDTDEQDEAGNIVTEGKYLLEEIYDRTFKMYRECVYCMRFFPDFLRIKSISIQIDIFDEFVPLHDSISYRLDERGYPSLLHASTKTMCAKELTVEGKILSGEFLKERVEQKIAAQATSQQ